MIVFLRSVELPEKRSAICFPPPTVQAVYVRPCALGLPCYSLDVQPMRCFAHGTLPPPVL